MDQSDPRPLVSQSDPRPSPVFKQDSIWPQLVSRPSVKAQVSGPRLEKAMQGLIPSRRCVGLSGRLPN